VSPETRRAALRATARVAMVAAFGCHGQTPPETTAVPDHTVEDARTAADCEPIVAAGWDASGQRAKDGPSDANLKACCASLANEWDGKIGQQPGWDKRTECCTLLEWQGSATCTPWGPPVPPSYARERMALA
jgi:hypothetical protein